MKKIAIIGSHPSSVALAPYHDTEWTIWPCSPGAWPHAKRVDAYFELHRRELNAPWFSKEYIKFLSEIDGPVYVAEPWPEIPNHVLYPRDEMLIRFGPNFWTTSVCWMLAFAITQQPEEIGLWGIDMSADEEREGQRLGTQRFIEVARNCGIRVTAPPESDILRPAPLYGFQEVDPLHVKWLARLRELEGQGQAIVRQVQELDAQYRHLCGAIDNMKYMLKIWVHDPKQIELSQAHHGGKVKLPDDLAQFLVAEKARAPKKASLANGRGHEASA